MGIKKVTLLSLESANEALLDNLYSLGSEVVEGKRKSVKVAMSLLRGNTAFREWQERNPGKTYSDWIKTLQQPATDAAAEVCKEIVQISEEASQVITNTTTATTNANRATDSANEATRLSGIATKNANEATGKANKAASDADTSRVGLDKIKQDAITATSNANTATGNANKATGNAITATGNANTQADRAKELADHPTMMGENGNWWKWDTTLKRYVDTGVLAKGGVLYPTFEINHETMELVMSYQDEIVADMFNIDEEGNLTFNPK